MRFLKKDKNRSPNPSRSLPIENDDLWQSPIMEQPITFSTAQTTSPAIVSRPQENVGKTRLIGFDTRNRPEDFGPPEAEQSVERPSYIPVGWLVVTTEPGRGQSFPLMAGLSTIGRGKDQAVCLDFGDRSISRDNHAAIVYDSSTNEFFLGHGGKANLVRMNGAPVTKTTPIQSGAEIQIGDTKLRFKALCDTAFQWDMTSHMEDGDESQF